MGLVLVIFAVWLTLLLRRFAHVASHPPRTADFAHAEAVALYFRPVERPAQNLANLCEMPVLYFALVPLLMLIGQPSRSCTRRTTGCGTTPTISPATACGCI